LKRCGDAFERKYANCLRLSGGYGWDARIEKGVRALGAIDRTHITRNAS